MFLFLELDIEQQINQFVTINKEAKGVPTSLYYDLLKHLPNKNPAERSKERATDIANLLKKDEESTFLAKIVTITSPKRGELSLTTFVRAISPLITENKGFLAHYNINEQIKIIDNYYKAIKNIFPKYFNMDDSIFFKTTGFGAMFKALPVIFSYTFNIRKGGFTVADISEILKNISNYNFDNWKNFGTGNAAEILASDELKQEIEYIFSEKNEETKIRL